MAKYIATLFCICVVISAQANKSNSSVIQLLCNPKKESVTTGYKNGAVFMCGDFYRVRAPANIADAPDIIFNNKGKKVSYCGGMPGPVPRLDAKECNIKCQDKDLCK